MNPRYHFVIDEPDPARLARLASLDVDANPSVFNRGELNWCLQAYLLLKNRAPVSMGNTPERDAINLAHSAPLERLSRQAGYFWVCVQADFPACPLAHYHLVQNRTQEKPGHASLVWHWPQPGLIARDPTRTGVRHVAYAGTPYNNNFAAADQWPARLAAEGLTFSVLPPDACHDLSGIDVLLAIRSFDHRPYNTKPASKLVNAWMANIPLIAGHDSAFKQIGRPGENYLLVSSFEETLQAIRRLRDDAGFYERLVKNGAAEAVAYSRDAVIARWLDVLAGPVTQRFNEWRAHPRKEFLRRTAALAAGLPMTTAKAVVRRLRRR